MDNINAVVHLVSLSKILRNSIITDDSFFEELGSHITLTELGSSLYIELSSKFTDISPNYMKTVLFQYFYSENLFLDLTEIKLIEIEKIISTNIYNQIIKYPWLFDNLLYDKYFDTVISPSEELSYKEVLKLLEYTPQGVYQYSNLVIGELGILYSDEKRNIEALKRLPLWHCPNPGCNIFHHVYLKTRYYDKLDIITDFVLEKNYTISKNPNEYYINSIFKQENDYNSFHTGQLPLFLGSCFSEGELKSLLEEFLENNQNNIRKKFSNIKKLSGSSCNIISNLNKAECLQIILTLDDITILNSLEKLIDHNVINIPPTEKRKNIFFLGSGANLIADLNFECSSLGFRITNDALQFGLVRLELLLKNLYSTSDEIEDLNWKLRTISLDNNSSKYEKLYYSIMNDDIKTILHNLVFCSIDKIKKASKLLMLNDLDFTNSHYDEERLLNKFIWKLGFDVYSFPSEIQIFWSRYAKFYDECTKCTTYNEDLKESIRSKSINFFVSLEELLQRSLNFMCWVLLSDHYNNTKFKYCYDKMKNIVYKHLNNYEASPGNIITFNPKGKDTLFPLIEGFNILALYCEDLLKNSEKYVKKQSEFPNNYNAELTFFPFLHKHLILDLEESIKDKIILELKNISVELKQMDTCNIRNSINHQRETNQFPTSEKLLEFCKNIKNVITKMENLGVYPLTYVGEKNIRTSYERNYAEMKNYREKTIKINYMNNCSYNQPSFNDPQIIVPFIRLRTLDTCMRFYIEETSYYSQLWVNYPKRHLK